MWTEGHTSIDTLNAYCSPVRSSATRNWTLAYCRQLLFENIEQCSESLGSEVNEECSKLPVGMWTEGHISIDTLNAYCSPERSSATGDWTLADCNQLLFENTEQCSGSLGSGVDEECSKVPIRIWTDGHMSIGTLNAYWSSMTSSTTVNWTSANLMNYFF